MVRRFSDTPSGHHLPFGQETDTTHLAPYRNPSTLDAMRVAAIESLRETSDYDRVRAARAPGRRYAAQVMAGRRRELTDAKVQAHGWAHLIAAIQGTQHLPVRDAAATTGLSANTIRRWRTKLWGVPRIPDRDAI